MFLRPTHRKLVTLIKYFSYWLRHQSFTMLLLNSYPHMMNPCNILKAKQLKRQSCACLQRTWKQTWSKTSQKRGRKESRAFSTAFIHCYVCEAPTHPSRDVCRALTKETACIENLQLFMAGGWSVSAPYALNWNALEYHLCHTGNTCSPSEPKPVPWCSSPDRRDGYNQAAEEQRWSCSINDQPT